MTLYKFETEQFGLSDTGIYLLRSRFNYETIAFELVDEIRIEKGKQLKNWLITYLFGVGLVLVGVYVLYHVLYEWFIGHRVHHFYIEQFVFPVLPLCVGFYSIYIALKEGWVMKVQTKNKRKVFSIEALRKQSKVEDFVIFLDSNNLIRNKFISSYK